jgi:hypothetical protein
MEIRQPSHVVTIGVWCPNTARAVHLQCWVVAGPFDDATDIASHLLGLLGASVDAMELIERRESQSHRHEPEWTQLALDVDA